MFVEEKYKWFCFQADGGDGSNGGDGGNGGDGSNGGNDDANAKLSQYAQEISKLKKQLKDRMSEDERKKQEEEERKQKYAELLARVNNSAVKASVGEARSLMKFEKDDKSFDEFLDYISAEDETQATERGTALNSLLKKFYEQGKKDALEEAGKNLSNGVRTGGNQGGKEESIGAQLAKSAGANADNKKFNNFMK